MVIENNTSNTFKDYWYDTSGTPITIGRRAKKRFLDVEFTFLEKDNCTADATFQIGVDKIKYYYRAEGKPAIVLDKILNQVEPYYKIDIIDRYELRKLAFMQTNAIEYSESEFQGELAKGFFTSTAKKLANTNLKKEQIEYKKKGGIASLLNSKDQQDHVEKWKKFRGFLEKPNVFKSYKTREVINLGIYESLTPSEILTQRIQLTNTSIPELAEKIGLDISTVYKHVKGDRDVDRKTALRYASYFGCDPADILFPPVKIPVTGKVDFLDKVRPGEIIYSDPKSLDQSLVLCPRDFYSSIDDIRAVKVASKGSVYNDHVVFYYYTNKKEDDCENKICFIVAETKPEDKGPFHDIFKDEFLGEEKWYYIGIYENHRGTIQILNPDPFRKGEVMVTNPNIKFITPIIGIVNIDKVKFSPIEERSAKKVSEHEQLRNLEKELDIAEQAWYVEGIKMKKNPKAYNLKSTQMSMQKQYSNLKQLRLKVQQLRANLYKREIEDQKPDTIPSLNENGDLEVLEFKYHKKTS